MRVFIVECESNDDIWDVMGIFSKIEGAENCILVNKAHDKNAGHAHYFSYSISDHEVE